LIFFNVIVTLILKENEIIFLGKEMKRILSAIIVFTAINFAQTYHTITLDAVLSDWNNAAEQYTAPGSQNVNWYFTWDNTNFYLAAERTSGSTFGDADALTIFIDTDANLTPDNGTGSTTGNLYQGVTATLPFSANYAARIERSYKQSDRWNGSTWTSITNSIQDFNNGDTRTVREVSIPWTEIGNETKPNEIYFLAYISYNTGVFASVPFGNELQNGNGASKTFTNYFGGYQTISGINPNGTTDTPLPVELTSFSASVIRHSIKLNWQTATEVNNYGFEVERNTPLNPLSRGDVEGMWEKIGFVNGNGNSNSPKSYSFVDDNVSAGSYSYRLKQIDNDGQFEYSKVVEVSFMKPTEFSLAQNYPNPFNPATTIQFTLPQAGNVKLTLFNLLGQKIKTLINEYKESGVHTLNFNASELNSGLYIYKLEANGLVKTRKMTLVK